MHFILLPSREEKLLIMIQAVWIENSDDEDDTDEEARPMIAVLSYGHRVYCFALPFAIKIR